ncbi:hypothetical protein GCM10022243_05660 [Saccharothrix violaceirubra]|uniref:Uncharacterized protein n=1 Tax=Saccharothrix violaceirubra TaxID=413306 RepID=A0A7W7SXY4_9PSEU|nr:hypothetical protein [Saccharothrix violaceirubra]MBB4962976.1 hypothetical protein [Saccharothrix violaceirubra]
MSNDDKRRRLDGSTDRLSVADLIARREAETQPIPRIEDDEPGTVRIASPRTDLPGRELPGRELPGRELPGRGLSGRELHVTELLRREGRAGEEERGGGMSVPKLVALASGGVVLCGTVAFAASQWLSSPDERPAAEVRYDTRPAARGTNTIGNDLAAEVRQSTTTEETTAETTTGTTVEDQPRQTVDRPRSQQPQPTTTQPPTTGTPTTTTPGSTTAPTTTTPTTTDPPANPTTTASSTPASAPDAPTGGPSSAPSTEPSVPSAAPSSEPSSAPSAEPSATPLIPTSVLGVSLDPIGAFDFFAPAS